MPNRNYRKGYALERRVSAEWRDAGYECVESRGSHGPGDVWASQPFREAGDCGWIDAADLYIIQCKAGTAKASKTERKALRKSAENAGGMPLLATTPKRGAILYQGVTRNGLIPFDGP